MSNTDKDLMKFQLSDEEWSLLLSLTNVLQVTFIFEKIYLNIEQYIIFKDFDFATNRISQTKYPTAAIIIPMFKLLLDKLETSKRDSTGMMKDACTKAFEKLTTYFKYMDTSALWVAMGTLNVINSRVRAKIIIDVS